MTSAVGIIERKILKEKGEGDGWDNERGDPDER
jgi:hypothetical protein